MRRRVKARITERAHQDDGLVAQLLLRVLSRALILEKVWGYAFENQSNAIDVHIASLRRKIDANHDLKLIHTVKGIGYVLDSRHSPTTELAKPNT